MNRQLASMVGVLTLVLGACGPSGAPTPGSSVAATVAATAAATPAATASSSPIALPTVAAACPTGADEVWVAVDGRANLFGAGHDSAPAPGGDGGGLLPPLIELPAGDSRLVTFPCTGGLTDFSGGLPAVGPDGFAGLTSTHVESHGGISGMLMETRVMFLAGVFLSGEEPADPAPKRLDFTGNAEFDRLEPELGQTFFIADGTGRTFVAPAGATRLYLGFIDAYVFEGKPGWYGNNRGALEATVAIAVD